MNLNRLQQELPFSTIDQVGCSMLNPIQLFYLSGANLNDTTSFWLPTYELALIAS